jgi:hypothetical protein
MKTHAWLDFCAVFVLGWFAVTMPGSVGPKAVEPKEGLVCLLVNKNSGRCLSVADKSVNPGAKIVQGPMPDQAGAAEHWLLLGSGPAFRLLNENSRLVVEIGHANSDPGVQAIQWHDQITAKHQLWTFESVDDGYLLRTGHAHYVLSIGQGSLDAGAPALQWEYIPNVPEFVWELRSTKAVASPEAGPMADEPKSGSLVLAVALTVPIVFFSALAIWLLLRSRRGTPPDEPHTDKPANPEGAGAPISLTCSCGKNLKVKAELAGKNVRCTQCGMAVLVPRG